MKDFILHLTEELHREVKIRAAELNTTMHQFILDAVVEKLEPSEKESKE